MEAVRLREDAQDMVVIMGSASQLRDCPIPYEEGATDYAKLLKLIIWDNTAQNFRSISLA
jgi:hypothetical protein